ncbi:MAG: 50S ribosomal protein L3 [Firmicutes bacterium]|jgi:large subunit ribosomal protein L3|nr:50S ribosomal protein L3 [Bacillota bacterium]
MKGILGRKLGMTQIIQEDGTMVPVTVIEAGPCVVIQKKTVATDGYNALQIGFGSVRESKVTKPLRGHFAKNKLRPVRYLREFRVENPDSYEVGQEIKADVFSPGEKVNVTGISRGKGFAGVIKRWGARRGRMSHGSKFHRAPGTLSSPRSGGRVFPGRKMPGRMGYDRVTVRNLRVVRVDPERNLLMVKGSVPGARGRLVSVRVTE